MHLRSLTRVFRLTYLTPVLMLVTASVTTPTPDLTPTPEPPADNFYFLINRTNGAQLLKMWMDEF